MGDKSDPQIDLGIDLGISDLGISDISLLQNYLLRKITVLLRFRLFGAIPDDEAAVKVDLRGPSWASFDTDSAFNTDSA